MLPLAYQRRPPSGAADLPRERGTPTIIPRLAPGYRQRGFPKNRALRIDHILCSEGMAARCRSVTVDREARKGETPSDRAPVVAADPYSS